ncbi:MAG TPA: hypothetical protein VK982_11475 [Bacteroidales bacterium]|nr:hypothetical protein [Bacteroidales bacterium]
MKKGDYLTKPRKDSGQKVGVTFRYTLGANGQKYYYWQADVYIKGKRTRLQFYPSQLGTIKAREMAIAFRKLYELSKNLELDEDIFAETVAKYKKYKRMTDEVTKKLSPILKEV